MSFQSNLSPSQGGVELKPISFSTLSSLKSALEESPEDVKDSWNHIVLYLGACPITGCIEQDKDGNWRIISNKTGEYWNQKYKSQESARKALAAYHIHH